MIDRKAEKNYADFIELPRKPDSNKQAFTHDEVTALWDLHEKLPIANYILLMIYTGMALGELQNVKRENIDFEKWVIRDVGTKNALRKKTPIFIANVVRPILKDLYETSAGFDRLLNMGEGTFYESYYDALRQASCRRLTPHCCRHTTATALAEAGVQPAIIKTIMRHSNYQTTTEYTHIDESKMIEALDLMLPRKI